MMVFLCKTKLNYASSRVVSVVLLLCAVTYLPGAHAQFNPQFLEHHSVRVIARGPNYARAASGFLWQRANQIVTSLHAVPHEAQIIVECRGVSRVAQVSKTLVHADLALLVADGLPELCTPIMSANTDKPGPYSDLYTFGYHAGARSGTSRAMKKGYASSETLDNLITEKPLEALLEIGMPAVDLDVYYVEGGLLPGYSGGPVVNSDKELVGVVDGGLNNGQASYNWVIPAAHLYDLLESEESDVPIEVAQLGGIHFASGIVDADRYSVIEYEFSGVNYEWVLTKTLSVTELFNGDSEDPVEHMREYFLPGEHEIDINELRVSVYEEVNTGLIVVLPNPQKFYAASAPSWLQLPGPLKPGLVSAMKQDVGNATAKSINQREIADFTAGNLEDEDSSTSYSYLAFHHFDTSEYDGSNYRNIDESLKERVLEECNSITGRLCVIAQTWVSMTRFWDQCGSVIGDNHTNHFMIKSTPEQGDGLAQYTFYNTTHGGNMAFASVAGFVGPMRNQEPPSNAPDGLRICEQGLDAAACDYPDLWNSGLAYFISASLSTSKNARTRPAPQPNAAICRQIDEALFMVE